MAFNVQGPGGAGMTARSAQEFPDIAVAIVVQGRVLVVRRRVAEGQLSWQFPAGQIEPMSGPVQAHLDATLAGRAPD